MLRYLNRLPPALIIALLVVPPVATSQMQREVMLNTERECANLLQGAGTYIKNEKSI